MFDFNSITYSTVTLLSLLIWHPLQSCQSRKLYKRFCWSFQQSFGCIASLLPSDVHLLYCVRIIHIHRSFSCIIITVFLCKKKPEGAPAELQQVRDQRQLLSQVRSIILFLYLLSCEPVHHPLWCSTDRRCVLILPLCRHKDLGDSVFLILLLFCTCILQG